MGKLLNSSSAKPQLGDHGKAKSADTGQ